MQQSNGARPKWASPAAQRSKCHNSGRACLCTYIRELIFLFYFVHNQIYFIYLLIIDVFCISDTEMFKQWHNGILWSSDLFILYSNLYWQHAYFNNILKIQRCLAYFFRIILVINFNDIWYRRFKICKLIAAQSASSLFTREKIKVYIFNQTLLSTRWFVQHIMKFT